jgi:hypothetical protein
LVKWQTINHNKNGWTILNIEFIRLNTKLIKSRRQRKIQTCSIKLRICDGNCVWHFNWTTDSSWNTWENNKIPSLNRIIRYLFQWILFILYFRIHSNITRSKTNNNTCPFRWGSKWQHWFIYIFFLQVFVLPFRSWCNW